MSKQTCVIVGAGHAAAQLVASLVQGKWPGRIVLVGEEPWLPYNRPPLSKSFLAGDKQPEELLIRPAASYDRFAVEYRLGVRVESLSPDSSSLSLADGSSLGFTHLALCTGGHARRLSVPGSELGGVYTLRTIQDVTAIREALPVQGRVAIVGGGYIGLETAAMLRSLGYEVTVLETAERLLHRVTAPAVSSFFRELHEANGVRLVTGARVTALEGTGVVNGVRCEDGSLYPCDLVIAGIGLVPETRLAQSGGLEVNDGVLVDEYCRTSRPNVVAAGDCTRFPCLAYGGRGMRLESVQNAVDQAKTAAATLCGSLRAYDSLPWFWSDQYDIKFQIAGLSQGYDDVLIRGNAHYDSSAECRFSAFYLKEGRVIAVDAVNSPQDFMMGKRLVSAGILIDRQQLADTEVSLRSLLPG